ncbi:hypothetical protein A1O7_03905 [Cladophialophora yegresii CBS 114405]|uniref:Calcineurin-like phosphoesterase domain-containing protein n=1 Tax=Cladophialophora yegresii CBS 114405 TaxID=1182544 RepID=W9VVR6_9EURO|nr:uncharacterized protein A1O7_03905 [Cladophialophora yegresii CBS 114405]EXJ59758.1 hypothetical protein A1O7_03905 [Cladophialophora yegresii CBS 114405]
MAAPKGYDVFEIVPKAAHLVLLGDLHHFRTVLLVPSNHEGYHSAWHDTPNILRTFKQDVRNNKSLGEFILLDRTAFRLPDTDPTILGCSLFSWVPAKNEMAVSMGLNDFFHTNDWDVGMHNEAQERDLAWLNGQVVDLEQQSDVKKIMIFPH